MEGPLLVAFTRAAGVLLRGTGDVDLLPVEARLNPECASRTPLASEAVANRDATRVSFHHRPELTAAARRLSLRHGQTIDRIRVPQRSGVARESEDALRALLSARTGAIYGRRRITRTPEKCHICRTKRT